MAYEPKTWVNLELITAEDMNHLEQGVANEQVGPPGPAGADGAVGPPGNNATINGVNTLTIQGGTDVTASQSGSVLTLGLKDSGVAAGTYGPFLNGVCWMANNGGIKSSTATWTLTAKKAGLFRFLYAGGAEENYDYITVTHNGISILNTKGTNINSPYGGYVEVTLAVGDVVVFSHVEDSSNFYDGDYAGVGNLVLGNTNTQFDAITPENISTYFTVEDGTYTFTSMVVFTGGMMTVDAKGRITTTKNIYPTIYTLDQFRKMIGSSEQAGSPTPGPYYTPSVSSAGVISWTNNGGLTNPASVNIKGPKGDTGAKGDTGPAGADGAVGPQGQTGPQGEPGKSAYQYAKEGGYTGTEAQFQALLATGPWIPAESVASISILTESQYNALSTKVSTTLYCIKE